MSLSSEQQLLSAQSSTRATNFRWVICALLFTATLINYMDRQVLSLLKGTLDKEIGWSDTQYGIVNSAFQIAYGLSYVVFGWFIDRFGTKIGYTISIVAWSIAAMGHALVSNFTGFLAARISLGAGEAGNFPVAVKSTALWFPKKQRAFATSIFNSGTNVGAVLGPATVPFIALAVGWRGTFVVMGLAGLVWLIFWLWLYEIPERSRRANAAEIGLIKADADEVQDEKVPWLSLLKYPQTWSYIVGKFFSDPVWWFFLIWLPDFFKKTRGLEITKSWGYLVTIYAIVTVLSIFGGWISGFLIHRGWSVTAARKSTMLLSAVAVVPIVFVTHLSIWPAVMLIGLAGSAHQSWSANLFTTPSDMFPKNAVGSVLGLGGLAGSTGGFMFPIFCGMILDHFKASGYSILFGTCAFAYLIAFAINHVLAPRFERVEIRD